MFTGVFIARLVGVYGCIYGWGLKMLRTDNIQITTDLLALFAEIEEFKGAWKALGILAPERLLALRRVSTIDSI